MNENRDCHGHTVRFPNGNLHKVCYGGQGEYSSKQIASHLNQIPHSLYVEPFLGHGQVYRYINHDNKKEILNDLSCSRVQGAKKNICRTNKACEALETAQVSCGKDYKTFLKKYDKAWTLHMLLKTLMTKVIERIN